MVIKRFGPVSVGKIAGTLYAAMGLLIGAVVSLIALAGGFTSDNSAAGPFAALIGVGAIVFFPILYGAMGFLFTLIAAALYTVVAGWVARVDLDVQYPLADKSHERTRRRPDSPLDVRGFWNGQSHLSLRDRLPRPREDR